MGKNNLKDQSRNTGQTQRKAGVILLWTKERTYITTDSSSKEQLLWVSHVTCIRCL